MNSQPIIIRRKRRGGHGHAAHHGGAWKVAFADFMTAMMAFFLVMWILGLSESTRRAIAGYFREPGLFEHVNGKGQPVVVDDATLGMHRGDGSGGVTGTNRTELFYVAQDDADDDKTPGSAERKIERAVADDLRKLAATSPELRPMLGSVTLEVTALGVRVELVDNKHAAYFNFGSAHPGHAAEKILRTLAKSIAKLPNVIEIEGHTDAHAFSRGSSYTNWELSADRANAVRKILMDGGVPESRVAAVSGLSCTVPRVKGQAFDVGNRRVALLLRRNGNANASKPNAR